MARADPQVGGAQYGTLQYGGVVNAAATLVTDADTASGAELQALVAVVVGTDTASGTSTEAYAARLTDPELGSGTSSESEAIQSLDADMGVGLDGQLIAPINADAGSGTSTESLSVTESDDETGHGADVAELAMQLSEIATGTEDQTLVVAVNDFDTATSFEVATFDATLADADTGVGVDREIHAAQDTGSGTEDNFIAVTLEAQLESGVGADGELVIRITDADSAHGVEAVAGLRLSAQTDTGTADEEASLLVFTSNTDFGFTTDGQGGLQVTVSDRDTFSAVDAESIIEYFIKTDADSGHGVEGERVRVAGLVRVVLSDSSVTTTRLSDSAVTSVILSDRRLTAAELADRSF